MRFILGWGQHMVQEEAVLEGAGAVDEQGTILWV